MRVPTRRLVALLALAGPACTTLIGLPDLPELHGDGGSAKAGATSTPTGGSNGAGVGGRSGGSSTGGNSAGGGSSGTPSTMGGSSSSGEAGELNGGAGTGGSAPCGADCAGSASTMGGSSSGGTGGTDGGSGGNSGTGGGGAMAGTGGSDVCDPRCSTDLVCQAGECVCRGGPNFKQCSGLCVDTTADPDHCGSCSGRCPYGCTAGRCFTTLSASNTGTGRIAVNAKNVFFTRGNDDTIFQVPRGGGNVTSVATGQTNANALTLDANNLYWVNSGTIDNNGAVMKIAMSSGGDPMGDPVTLLDNLASPESIAVDSTYVYFGLYMDGFYKTPIASGTTMTPVATGDDAHGVSNIITDSQNVYWTTQSQEGSIEKLPLTGVGSPELLATNALGVFNSGWIAQSGSFLYFLQRPTGRDPEVAKANTATVGNVTTVKTITAGTMDADSTAVYLGSDDDDTIVKVSLDGSTVTTLVEDTGHQIYVVKVDGTDLFWFNQAGDLNVTSTIP